ncbi:SDR family NAD(P)-dependent oxidoreductase [Streptomyces sp. NPDC056716]|uniref:SDR family NAD(P)-dependent oxidoreductase n=1 Tax=unclassified Streptomyces TaxID=2593676 RepID=UPI0036CA81E2
MAMNAYDLTGRTAVATDATSGIGRVTAVLPARAGATMHRADLDTRGLHETATATAIKADGGTAHTHHLDFTDRARVREVVETCETLHVMAPIAGLMHSSQVLMASGATDIGGPGLLCYGTAKTAVVQLTKTLATKVGRHSIHVNAVAPDWIRTPMTQHPPTSSPVPPPSPSGPQVTARPCRPPRRCGPGHPVRACPPPQPARLTPPRQAHPHERPREHPSLPPRRPPPPPPHGPPTPPAPTG